MDVWHLFFIQLHITVAVWPVGDCELHSYPPTQTQMWDRMIELTT